jgi:Fic family protein
VFTFRVGKRAQMSLDRIAEIAEMAASAPAASARWFRREQADASCEAVAASLTLSGMPLSAEDARRVLANDRPALVSPETAEYALALCDAREYALTEASAGDFRFTVAFVQAVHHRALAPDPDSTSREIREVAAAFRPPAEQVEWLLGQALASLGDSASADVPAPVLAALAHAYLTAITPFGDGNGRTARIIASAAMEARGLTSPLFTTLDVWWSKHPEAYRGLLGKLDEEWNPNTDMSAFVEGYVKAAASHAEADLRQTRAFGRIWSLLESAVSTDLSASPRSTNALFDAFLGHDVTTQAYERIARVTEAIANHDLGKLAGLGLLQRKGAGRGARYIATPALYELVAHCAGLDQRWLLPSGSAGKRRDAVLAGLDEGAGEVGDVRD